jgi:hypothetical protein
VKAIVDVPVRTPEPLLATKAEVERFVAPVPPFATPSVPVTCVARFTCPVSVENPIQLLAMAKQPAAKLAPLAKVDVAVPV